MASHSSCRALTNVTRNLTDDQIKRIAKAGGVVMINIGSKFIDQDVVDWYIAHQWPLVGKPRASWTKVVDHIEHVIAIAGENAVGLGTDFDGIVDPPTGLGDYAALPKLTEEMLRRGWSDERVKKVLGENFLAFFARVEAVRVSLAKEPPSTATLKRAR
jgi:membrane dipeptidase